MEGKMVENQNGGYEMATRSLNKVMLIGNLTRDPELRYTPQGTPVCSFGMATNRSWRVAGTDEIREEAEFHNIVAWSKLGELCAQLLSKGRKVYIEGRLQTRSWETQDGQKRTKTEIIASDMIVLDSRFKETGSEKEASASEDEFADILEDKELEKLNEERAGSKEKKTEVKKMEKKDTGKSKSEKEEIDLDSVSV